MDVRAFLCGPKFSANNAGRRFVGAMSGLVSLLLSPFTGRKPEEAQGRARDTGEYVTGWDQV